MKIEIDGGDVRFEANGKALVVHSRTVDGVEVLSFEVGDGTFLRSGHLPSIEMSPREVVLRHRGNRIEQVSR